MFLILSTSQAFDIQVIDNKTGEALPGVNITIVGSSDGMNTEINGHFELDDKYMHDSLRFSYMGYVDTTLSYHQVLNLRVVRLNPDILNMKEVEVVSSKLEWEQTDLPSIVTVLRTKDLVNQGSVEIKEALQRDPSVVIDESAVGEHEISIRGSNANEVLIIYDGIPLNSSYAGGFDLSWLNLNDIESISIIKGAGTLRYGPGAFGGVVLLTPVKSGSTGLSLNYQSTDRHLNAYSISDVLRLGSLRTRLTYSGQQRLPLGYYNEDIISTRAFINFYSTYALRDTSNYFSLNVIDISEEVDPFPLFEEQKRDKYIQLKYTGEMFGSMNIGFQALKRNKGDEQVNDLDPILNYANNSKEETELIAMESKMVFKTIINYTKLEAKNDYFKGVSNTKNIHWEYDDRHEISLEQKLYSFTDIFKFRTDIDIPYVDFIELNASYRYDKIQLDKSHQAQRDGKVFIDDFLEDKYDQISKRSGFTISKTQKHFRYQLFYTAGTNLRYPTMYEMYLRDQTTIGIYQDSPLYPELNSSSEFGLQASIRPKNERSVFGTFDFQASFYRNRYIDKIHTVSIPRALPTPINEPSSDMTGFEFSGMTSMFGDLVNLYFGRTVVDISSFTVFPNKPEFRDVVESEFRVKSGSLRLQYFHEGKQFYGGTPDNLIWYIWELPGRENVNVYSSWKFKTSGKEYVLGISALNILSEENETNYFMQRKWTASLGISFNSL